MASVASAPAAVKGGRKSKTERSLALLEAPSPQFEGFGAFRVTEGKKVDLYLFREIKADFGRGFEVEKLGPDLTTVESYAVNLNGRQSSCECKGNVYCSHCRHVEALSKLDERGQLPKLIRQKHVACPGCGDESPEGRICPGCQAEDDAYWKARQEEAEMVEGGIDPWEGPEVATVGDAWEPPVQADF